MDDSSPFFKSEKIFDSSSDLIDFGFIGTSNSQAFFQRLSVLYFKILMHIRYGPLTRNIIFDSA